MPTFMDSEHSAMALVQESHMPDSVTVLRGVQDTDSVGTPIVRWAAQERWACGFQDTSNTIERGELGSMEQTDGILRLALDNARTVEVQDRFILAGRAGVNQLDNAYAVGGNIQLSRTAALIPLKLVTLLEDEVIDLSNYVTKDELAAMMLEVQTAFDEFRELTEASVSLLITDFQNELAAKAPMEDLQNVGDRMIYIENKLDHLGRVVFPEYELKVVPNDGGTRVVIMGYGVEGNVDFQVPFEHIVTFSWADGTSEADITAADTDPVQWRPSSNSLRRIVTGEDNHVAHVTDAKDWVASGGRFSVLYNPTLVQFAINPYVEPVPEP